VFLLHAGIVRDSFHGQCEKKVKKMNTTVTRRRFLAGISASIFSCRAHASAQSRRLETFAQWMNASPAERAAAVKLCLDRIREMDPKIQAWVQVAPQPPLGDGPLSGIPFGAKDIMETRGLSTEYGSPIYKGRLGSTDAAIVTSLRQRGAILLGKTHTTAFAYRTPGPTHNPRNLEHTPGGSSSGSAAAVAAGMVPFALGTQTRGSILRPASYCGVTGFKPTYGLVPVEGVLPYAKSLDTIGFFAHTPTDMLMLWEAMGHSSGADETLTFGFADPMPEVDAEMATAIQKTIDTLRRAGNVMRPVDIAGLLKNLDAATNDVAFYEGARFHEQRWKEYGAKLQDLADLVEKGLKMPAEQYERALRTIQEGRSRIGELYKTTQIILVPAATGAAPLGLSNTGDPRINAPWTGLGTPAVSIPLPVSGLPLGLQLTAERGQDARVLRAAVRLHRLLT
jgi:Asp-tRNA(Asn)/Glu-tRNA(Gln) amidotransferase A subunit family amidase